MKTLIARDYNRGYQIALFKKGEMFPFIVCDDDAEAEMVAEKLGYKIDWRKFDEEH